MSKRNRRRRTPDQRKDARRNFVRYWIVAPLRIMLLAVLGVGLGFGGYRVANYLRTSAALAVRCIEVVGLVHTSADEIKKSAGLSEGQNIFSIDLQQAKRHLEEHPWIRKASVRRIVPDRLVVTVEEQKAAAAVAMDGLYLVNTHGEIFKRVQPGELVDFALITGLDRDAFRRDPKRVGTMIRKSLKVIGMVENTACLAHDRLAELHLDDLMGTSLVLDPGALRVEMGSKVSKHRLLALCRLLGEVDRLNMSIEKVLMDDPVHPYRVVVKLSRVATAAQTDKSKENERI